MTPKIQRISVAVENMEFTCPLCGFRLQSGGTHQCSKVEQASKRSEGKKKIER